MGSSELVVTGQRRIEPTEAQVAYIAGYLDGEGCFTFVDTPVIEITNTYPHTLMWIKQFFGGTVSMRSSNRTSDKWRTTYRYKVCGANALHMCRSVTSYIQEKRLQLEAVLAMSKLPKQSEARKQLQKELSLLKVINYV